MRSYSHPNKEGSYPTRLKDTSFPCSVYSEGGVGVRNVKPVEGRVVVGGRHSCKVTIKVVRWFFGRAGCPSVEVFTERYPPIRTPQPGTTQQLDSVNVYGSPKGRAA